MTETTAIETLPEAEVAAPPLPDDAAFRYGWRYVRGLRPDGYGDLVPVPLTLDDVLHPEEEDHVTYSEAHQRRCVYLYNVLRARVANDPTAVVLRNVRIKWDVPEVRPHGPDLMVIRGVRDKRNWSTFDVAQEVALRPMRTFYIAHIPMPPLIRSCPIALSVLLYVYCTYKGEPPCRKNSRSPLMRRCTTVSTV